MNSTCIKGPHANLTEKLEKDGYAVIENLVPADLIARLKKDLEFAIQRDAEYHKGKEHPDFAMVLFCPLYGDSFLDLLQYEPYLAPIEAVMGESCILYSYTSSSMPPSAGNYSCRIHLDALHTVPKGYINKLQTLVALDDFTLENGATYVLPGSHRLEAPPEEEAFYDQAIRLELKAGSVWFGHPRIYHAGAPNNTTQWRHAITTVWCKAYMKQRIDVPRLMPELANNSSTRLLQKIGFHAQVPTSYDEYYASPEMRKFKQALE